MTTTPTPAARAEILARLEFQNGRLVKVDGMRPEYMDGHSLIRLARELAAAIQPDPEPKHPDDEAVDRFAAAMKTKLRKKRAEGRSGWDGPECDANVLTRLLREHVEKGDPLDVGNLAMMLHQRGERICAPTDAPVAWLSRYKDESGTAIHHTGKGYFGSGWENFPVYERATPSSAGTVSVEAAALREVLEKIRDSESFCYSGDDLRGWADEALRALAGDEDK